MPPYYGYLQTYGMQWTTAVFCIQYTVCHWISVAQNLLLPTIARLHFTKWKWNKNWDWLQSCVLLILQYCPFATFITRYRHRKQTKGVETHEMGTPSSSDATPPVQDDSNSLHDPEKSLLRLDAWDEKAMEAAVIENPQTLMTSIWIDTTKCRI